MLRTEAMAADYFEIEKGDARLVKVAFPVRMFLRNMAVTQEVSLFV